MRLDEITKSERRHDFKHKLQDPQGEAIRRGLDGIKEHLNSMGWDTELSDEGEGDKYLLLTRQEFSKFPSNKPSKLIKKLLADLAETEDIVSVGGELHRQKGIDLDWHLRY